MPAARRLALLAVIATLTALFAVPALAGAQTTSVPQLTPSVTTPTTSTTPSTPAKSPAAKPAPAKAQLPNTGVDARLIAAVGVALLLCGVGLRMRSAEEHF